MKTSQKFITSFGLLYVAVPLVLNASDKKQPERPNILWLTFEDTSAYEFACYGQEQVHTPNVDNLAKHGVQFMNAWSVAPQSSPARSSLITGCYATTYGMDVHPVPHDTPANIFFPQFLRDAGYYCTNNNKTHYNTTIDNKICWDECDNTASYNSTKRGKDQPFFAVFNTVTSHMGRVRTFHTDGRRDYTQEGIFPSLLKLPDYVPDLPEVRSDYAGHLEAVQDVDTWVGKYLKDLKDKGLDQNTIIFVFSDHGGCLPRGKGFLYESGLRVPLVVYFPEKWKSMAQGLSGKCSRLVNFTDLGPTVLSLAGIKTPRYMQGKAVFGKYAVKEAPKVQYAIAANQLQHYMPVRAVTDGHYKYIRSYIPFFQFALRNYYQWGMPANKAWDKYVFENPNARSEWAQPFYAHNAEMLFDLDKDPGEINDLSENPAYRSKLIELRDSLSQHIRQTKDLGFFLPSTRFTTNMYNFVRKVHYPLEQLYQIAEVAGTATTENIPYVEKMLTDKHSDMRYWAAVGCAQLAHKGLMKTCPESLMALLDDADPYVAAAAAYAVTYLGHPKEGIARLVNPKVEQYRKMGYSCLESISLDKNMKAQIMPFLADLKTAAETLPRKENEDAGLMARGILVNLGAMPISNLHGPEAYKLGLKLNRDRRPMLPLPY